jgi:hypothetical protein
MGNQPSTNKSTMNFKPGLILAPWKPYTLLAAAPDSYRAPLWVDYRAELLQTSDQGNTQQCAAYAMAGWLEHYRWKFDGITEQIDPAPIYARAKEIDGYPGVEGTTLQAVVQAAQDLKLLANVSGIRELTGPKKVKRALHRYGPILAAFSATDKWSQAKPNGWMENGGAYVGGHAGLLCGYSDDQKNDRPYLSLQGSYGPGSGWQGFVRMSPEQFEQEFYYGLIWDNK